MKTTKMKEWARREVDLAKTWLNDEYLSIIKDCVELEKILVSSVKSIKQ